MIKAIIFDLNGVIIESTDNNAQIFAKIFKKYGKKTVNRIIEHYKQNGGIPRQKRIELYLKKFIGIEPSEKIIKQLSEQFSQLFLESLKNTRFVPGAIEFLHSEGQKYDNFLSTGAPQEDIPQILKILKLENIFIKGYGAPASKTEHIAQIMKNYGYKNTEITFIGDSPKDKQAAEKNNIYFIARDRNLISLKNEPFKIKNLTELKNVIIKINQSM